MEEGQADTADSDSGITLPPTGPLSTIFNISITLSNRYISLSYYSPFTAVTSFCHTPHGLRISWPMATDEEYIQYSYLNLLPSPSPLEDAYLPSPNPARGIFLLYRLRLPALPTFYPLNYTNDNPLTSSELKLTDIPEDHHTLLYPGAIFFFFPQIFHRRFRLYVRLEHFRLLAKVYQWIHLFQLGPAYVIHKENLDFCRSILLHVWLLTNAWVGSSNTQRHHYFFIPVQITVYLIGPPLIYNSYELIQEVLCIMYSHDALTWADLDHPLPSAVNMHPDMHRVVQYSNPSPAHRRLTNTPLLNPVNPMYMRECIDMDLCHELGWNMERQDLDILVTNCSTVTVAAFADFPTHCQPEGIDGSIE